MHKLSLSEDSDVREINLNESNDNSLLQNQNESFDLKNKYQMHLHHYGKYTPLSSDDSQESDDINTNIPPPVRKLQTKNTFFKTKSEHI